MAKSTTTQLTDQRRIDQALVQFYDSYGATDGSAITEDYVFLGGFTDVNIEMTGDEQETDSSGDCLFGETSSTPEFEGTFDLLADKNPWFIYNFLSRNNNGAQEGITLDTPVTGHTESIDVDYPIGEKRYLGIVEKYDWDVANTGGYVQNLVVTKTFDRATDSTVSVPLVAGTDYTLSMLNGKTAIVSIDGGALSEDDSVTVVYDYTPATQVNIQFCGERLLDTHKIRFYDLVDLYSADNTAKEVITFNEAEIPHSFVWSYKNCTDRDSITPSTITLRAKTGSCVDIDYFFV